MKLYSKSAAEIMARRRAEALDTAAKHTAELTAADTRIADIDSRLSRIPYRLFLAAGKSESFAALRKEAEELKRQRGEIAVSLGYPADYDEPAFVCEKCNDTGYIRLEKCTCLKTLEADTFMRSTKLGKGLENCTFESFDPAYFTDNSMNDALAVCKKYAGSFPEASGNLLLFGGTGLGKTHLAAAVAHVAASRGCFVVYESAVRLIADLRKAMYGGEDGADDIYYDCGLLIIDDLGTEVRSDYSVSVLSELIDKRIVEGLPVIISTNYEIAALGKVYGERLFSRLLGNFTPVHFTGKDVRMQKLKGKSQQ